jgi:hypothetical protein
VTAHLNAGGGGQTHLGVFDVLVGAYKPACGATAKAWFHVGLPVTCVRCPDSEERANPEPEGTQP